MISDDMDLDEEEAPVSLGSLLSQLREDPDEIARKVAGDVLAGRVRQLPSAVRTERAVVGGILLGGVTALSEAQQAGLSAADITQRDLAAIYGACVRLAAAGLPVDPVTLLGQLTAAEHETVGGALAVDRLVSDVTSAAPVGTYARHLVELSERRAILRLGATISAAAYSKAGVQDVLRTSQEALERVKRELPVGTGPWADLLSEARKAVLRAHTTQGRRWDGPACQQSLADLQARDLPSVQWIVSGVLREQAVFFLGGAPKEGKTWDANELAISIASGTKAWGEFTTHAPGAVLMFCLEDDERDLRNRSRALAHGDEQRQEALGRIFYEARGQLDLLQDDDVAGVIATARSLPEAPVVVIIDPFRDAHSGEENSNDDMRKVMQRLRLIRKELRCSVVVNHHMGKPPGVKGVPVGSAFDRFRGASAIRGAWDGAIAKETTSKKPTEIKSRMEVETRGGRGAGVFGLTLTIEDDAEGNAAKATWTFHRDVKELKEDTEERTSATPQDTKGAVLRAIRQLHYRDATEECETPTFNAPDIAAQVLISERAALRWLVALTEEGRVIREGKKFRYSTAAVSENDD